MIDKITPELKKRINETEDNEARIRLLQDAYADVDTMYILTCGTSLLDCWNEDLKQFLKGKMVVAVKQAVELFDRNDVDFHLYNKHHINPSWESDLQGTDTIRFCNDRPCVANPDIYFTMVRAPHDPDGPMHELGHVKKSYHDNARNYDKWDMRKTSSRPWGYGIVSNTGSYMPPFLGVKNTVIFGWDLVGGWFYHEGAKTNRKMNGRDSTMTKETIPDMLKFYEKYGCTVHLCSEISNLPIPRITLDEVMNG